MSVVCSLCVNIHPLKVSPESGASCLRPAQSSLCQRGFYVSLTRSRAGPPEWWAPDFNKPFHRGQISFLHGVSWVAPFTLSSPCGMCSAQRCLLDWTFRGVNVSPRQLLAPCASPSGGWPTARRPLLHTPSCIPRRTSPSFLLIPLLGLEHVSDAILMQRHITNFNQWLRASAYHGLNITSFCEWFHNCINN